MSEPIKFSVIIPTRERADTLVHCLHTVLGQNYDNFEVIVSDNFSQDNTKEVVDSFSDKRIRYFNTGKRVSMSHNWEFALNQIRSGWVMFIGDDDGLFPWALETLNRLIQKYNVETVFAAYDYFRWPGHFDDYPDGYLTLSLRDREKLKSTREELKRVFSGVSLNIQLPWLYEGGAASMDLINRSRDKNGRFFCSQIPDYYSAVALSFATDKYLVIESPIAMIGVSKHSSGTSVMIGKTDKEKQSGLRFMAEGNIPFHESLIFGKSFQIIMYESYLQSWHIHNGELGVSVADQLKVVERVAPSGILKDVIEQCQAIALKHNLTFVYKGPGFKFKLRRFFERISKRFWMADIDCKRLNVENVYDAVVGSAYIYKFLRQDIFCARLYLITCFIKHGFGKIRVKVFNLLNFKVKAGHN